MFTSLLKSSSLLLLLVSAAQCFKTTSAPTLTSFLGLPSTSPCPGILTSGNRGNPSSISLYHYLSDNSMRVRTATQDKYGKYIWKKRCNLGGSFAPNVPAPVDYNGTPVVFGIGTTTNLYYAVYDKNLDDFGPWVNLGGGCKNSPAAVYFPKRNEILVVIRGVDGSSYYRAGTPDTKFSDYVNLQGGYYDSPRLAAFNDDSKECAMMIGCGGDNYLYTQTYTEGKWAAITKTPFAAGEGWQSLNLYSSNYDASSGTYDSVTLIATTNNGQVYYAQYNTRTGWTNLIPFPYQVPFKFNSIDSSNGTLVYATSKDGQIYLSSFKESLCGNSYN